MENIFHKELIQNSLKISTFTGVELPGKNLHTSDIYLNFRFTDNEILTIICNYHGEFKEILTSTNKILNSHLLRFVEIKKELGLR